MILTLIDYIEIASVTTGISRDRLCTEVANFLAKEYQGMSLSASVEEPIMSKKSEHFTFHSHGICVTVIFEQ